MVLFLPLLSRNLLVPVTENPFYLSDKNFPSDIYQKEDVFNRYVPNQSSS